jgi:hypothetical protein
MPIIETEIWKKNPDRPGTLIFDSQRKAQDVFDDLKAHLEADGRMPDEYFLFDAHGNWKDGALFPKDAEIFCETNYGGSEGIYLDIFVRYKKDVYERSQKTGELCWVNREVTEHFATGKTLGDSIEDLDRMNLVASSVTAAFNGSKREIQERYAQIESGEMAPTYPLPAKARAVESRAEHEEAGDYSFEESIADYISIKSKPTAKVINGEVNYGDWVIVKPDEHYGCLIGQVTAIDKLGTDEHDTGNPGDDIHVNFIALEYSETAKAELLEALDGLYPNAADFDDIPLDDVIMAPDSLISLVGLDFESIDKLSGSYKAAREFGNKVLSEHWGGLETQLIARVEQNYADFNQSLLPLSKWDIIEKAAVIHAYSDAWSYMTAYHIFSDDELRFYSQFVNPLEVVADAWHKRNIDLEDMSGTMDFVYEQRNTHLAVYPLINDKPEPEKLQEQLKTGAAKEISAFDKALNRGKEKSEAYKAQKSQEPNNKTKKEERE